MSHAQKVDTEPRLRSPVSINTLRQRAQMVFKRAQPILPKDDLDRLPQATQKLLHELQVYQIELEMQNDELRQAHETLERTRARYFDLYDLAPVGYVTLAGSGRILEANLTLANLLGVHRSALVEHFLHSFVAAQHQHVFYLLLQSLPEGDSTRTCELQLSCPDGRLLWVQLQANHALDNGTPVLRLVLSDISQLKSAEQRLEYLAHYDDLTGLPNRQLKADQLQQAIEKARLSGEHLAVVYIDLDGFKRINDQYGHDVGDKLLIEVAHHMQQALRPGDSLARLGGDEFVAVLNNLNDTRTCEILLQGLLDAAAHPLPYEHQQLQVTASLGVTFYPQAEEIDGDQMLRQADQAMYRAKLVGKNSYQFFDAQQDQLVRGQHLEQHRLQQALANQELVLYFQPKVNLRSGQVIGVEALIRWQHPECGLLAPAAFLSVTEGHSLAIDIGEWVINQALTQIELWQAQGLEMAVSVNVDAHHLQQADFVPQLQGLMARHPTVQPWQLELEILENSALQDVGSASQVIEDCQLLGICFALDDFGTGYSSLTYLKRLRVAMLKIDQSFVRDMLDDPDDLSILEGILGLGRAFHCAVIAEGVETSAHGELLLQLGCELAQGYGIARPMPAQNLPDWIKSWQQNVPSRQAQIA
ncbi:MAG: Diguanylate cyclase/phosphodiesterase with PAS/PAC sensor(S) [Comamonadaceae bacterium]|nr:MAG: Diguanylate cyclase/phosphodiesterase with PAS/PAC sensor(S) [Comamonadaceae bacterium]